jgi:hypothetical protein
MHQGWLRDQAFLRAIDTINFEYLPGIDRKSLAGTKIKMPVAYDTLSVDDCVCFIAHSQQMPFRLEKMKLAHEQRKLKRRKPKARIRIVNFDEVGFRKSRFNKDFSLDVLQGIDLDLDEQLEIADLREQYQRSLDEANEPRQYRDQRTCVGISQKSTNM